jgi:hypothetical protein
MTDEQKEEIFQTWLTGEIYQQLEKMNIQAQEKKLDNSWVDVSGDFK